MWEKSVATVKARSLGLLFSDEHWAVDHQVFLHQPSVPVSAAPPDTTEPSYWDDGTRSGQPPALFKESGPFFTRAQRDALHRTAQTAATQSKRLLPSGHAWATFLTPLTAAVKQ
eukprot:4502504-Pyramimonas_sp.AAC.1